MRSISPELRAHLAEDVATLASVLLIKRQDGHVYRFTDHDQDLVSVTPIGSQSPGKTFLSAQGYERSAIADRDNLRVTSIDIEGFLAAAVEGEVPPLNSPWIYPHHIRARLLDYAEVMIALVNWADMGMGAMILRTGYLGEVVMRPSGSFDFEVRSLAQRVSQRASPKYQPTCRVDLGDRFTCNPPVERYRAWIGHVTSVLPGNRNEIGVHVEISDELGGQGTRYFNGGILRWSSGANAGLASPVKEGSSSRLLLTHATPAPIVAGEVDGDTFQIWPGCDKTFETCHKRFANSANFRGEPHLPGRDYLLYQAVGQPERPTGEPGAEISIRTIDDFQLEIGELRPLDLTEYVTVSTDPPTGLLRYYAEADNLNVEVVRKPPTSAVVELEGRALGTSTIRIEVVGAVGGRAVTTVDVTVVPSTAEGVRWLDTLPSPMVEVGQTLDPIDLMPHLSVVGLMGDVAFALRPSVQRYASAVLQGGRRMVITGERVGRMVWSITATVGAGDDAESVSTVMTATVVPPTEPELLFDVQHTLRVPTDGARTATLDLHDYITVTDGAPGTITFSIQADGTDYRGLVTNAEVVDAAPAEAGFARSVLRVTITSDSSMWGNDALIQIRATASPPGFDPVYAEDTVQILATDQPPEGAFSWRPIPPVEIEVGKSADLTLARYFNTDGDVGAIVWNATTGNTNVVTTRIVEHQTLPDRLLLLAQGVGSTRVHVVARTSNWGQSAVTSFVVRVVEGETTPPPPPPPPPPGKVTGVAIRNILQSGADVTWNAVPGAMRYRVRVEERATFDTTGRFSRSLETAASEYTITGLTPRVEYAVDVAAAAVRDADGWIWGIPSDRAVFTTSAGPLAAPMNVRWAFDGSGSGGRGTLSWDAVAGATRYEVFWIEVFEGEAPPREQWNIIGTPPQTALVGTSATFSLLPRKTYRMNVQAFTGVEGEWSAWSATVIVRTAGGALPVPASFRRRGTDTDVRLSWGAVPGAVAYEVETTSSGRVRGNPARVQGTSYRTGISRQTPYSFRVRAVGQYQGSFSPWAGPITAYAEGTQ